MTEPMFAFILNLCDRLDPKDTTQQQIVQTVQQMSQQTDVSEWKPLLRSLETQLSIYNLIHGERRQKETELFINILFEKVSKSEEPTLPFVHIIKANMIVREQRLRCVDPYMAKIMALAFCSKENADALEALLPPAPWETLKMMLAKIDEMVLQNWQDQNRDQSQRTTMIRNVSDLLESREELSYLVEK